MTQKITRNNHTLDASGRAVGRIASEIAVLLRGKQKPTFAPNVDNGDFVYVDNVKALKFTGKKLEKEVVYSHSQYPGGLKEKRLKTLFAENPKVVLRKAVWNMLPKNKLRSHMIKRLIIR